ncbi:MAG: hypothetical protein ACYC1I_10250 [Acidimicrobiales bacterium]
MVHASEVTQIIIGFLSLLVVLAYALFSNQVANVSPSPRAVKIIPGSRCQTPSYKNSRSTRRERRNQQSVSIIV